MTDIPAEWRELLSLIPSYDPVATAGGAWFEPEAARLALDFFPECLHHVEGEMAGKPFTLEPWQKSVVANLCGWKRRDEAGRVVRRYRELFGYVPRKNGKTPWVAGLCLLILFTDGEAGAQCYLGAESREQAGKLFRHTKGMIDAEPELRGRCRVYGGTAQAGQAKSIVLNDDQASFLQVISADADTQHGGNTHLAAIDELHTQPNRDLIDVLSTSMASQNRKQPLLITITTADYMRPSICNEKYDYASKVRDGVIPDPGFLPVIYEALPGEDWTSEAVWRKANPNLGVSVSLEYLRRECQRAKEIPAFENTFRRLHLNQRTETDVRAIPMDRWDATDADAEPVAWRKAQLERLRGRPCYAGLDLSTTTDLSALVLVFPEADGYVAVPFCWAPKENARKREHRDRVPYETWARQGLLRLTEGDVIDYDAIRRDIGELGKAYEIKEIAADRWNATQIITQLSGDGFEIVAYGQGFKDMTAPTKELLKLITEGKWHHGRNPLYRWTASNMATESDAAGNLKPSKKKSTERIDPMVGSIMALGRALVADVSDGPTVRWI